MNDYDLVKKVIGAAPIESPDFTGVPKAPTPSGDDDKQIPNVEYVSGKVIELKNIITANIKDLQDKINQIESTGIDVDRLKQEIIDSLKPSISDEIIADLGNQSVEISFSDLEGNQNSVLKQIDAVIAIVDEALSLSMDSYRNTLTSYKSELTSKRSQLVSYYNQAKTAYDTCCSNNTTENYANFTSKLKVWDEYCGEVLAYCQTVLNKLNNILLGLKADATQESIFNLLTNNGEAQGIYFANVTDDEGHTTKQLFISGEYMQMYGVDVKDLNKKSTFKVTKSGNVSINATEFTLKGKSISDTVSDAIASDETINQSINNATSGMNTTIENLTNKVNDIESNMGNVSEAVQEAIKDGAISAAEVNTIKKLYNDLSSRQTAVLAEINAVLALSNLSTTDKNELQSDKTSVVNSFSNVTTAYNNIINASTPTTSQFTAFDTAVTNLNKYVGIARAYCQTAQNNITVNITNTKLSNDREAVFNALTDNGTIQGITMVEDADTGKAQLYINGEYIQAEDFKAGNSITTPDIYAERINCVRIPTMLEAKCNITVNTDSSTASNSVKFEDGAEFKTLQGVLDNAPVFFNGNSVVVKLTQDITEDIEFRGFGGGALYILMCNHNIYGTIKIRDCHTVEIYGGSNTNENIPDKANRPVISPFKLIEDGESYYTVFAYGTPSVLLRNVNIYGKLAASDSVYTTASKNYAVGAGRGTLLNASNVAIINSDNGFKAVRGGRILSQATEGQCTKYGFYAMYGGMIDICSYQYGSLNVVNTATGGASKNYSKLDSEIINVGPNIVFDGRAIDVDDSNKQDSNVSNATTTTIKSNSAYSYRISGNYKGSWSTDNVAREGAYTTAYGKNKGFWFFGTLFNQFKGKNITKVVFTVNRQQAGAWSSSISMYLRWHTYETKTAASKAVTSTSSGPAMSTWVHAFTVKPVGNGAANTFTLDSTTEGANGPLAAIKAGTLKGFGIYNDSDKYQGYLPEMTVTVYCN